MVDGVILAAETPVVNGRGDAHSTAGFKALTLGSIGVVYGDIGTVRFMHCWRLSRPVAPSAVTPQAASRAVDPGGR